MSELLYFCAKQNEYYEDFLLDKDNKVAVIGNPVHSLAVKDLYLKQIATSKFSTDSQPIQTTAEAGQTEIDLGGFEQTEKKMAIFKVIIHLSLWMWLPLVDALLQLLTGIRLNPERFYR